MHSNETATKEYLKHIVKSRKCMIRKQGPLNRLQGKGEGFLELSMIIFDQPTRGQHTHLTQETAAKK